MRHKLSYFLLFALFSLSTQAQKLDNDTIFYDHSWHETSNKEHAPYFRIQVLEDTLYHFWDYYKENNQLQNEGYYHYENDKRYGLYTWFHKSGKKSMEGNYNANNREKKWTTWYKNGNVKSVGLYKENKRIQEWKWFHQDGVKQSIATYEDNKLSGKRTWWHKSGKIKQIGFFKAGIKVDEWITYYESGVVSSKKTYDNGQLNGKQFTYYKNEQLRSKEIYGAGILQSDMWYNEKGDKVEKEAVTSLKDNYALFWKISGNGLKKPSFLLGTMHIKDKKAFEYSDSLYKAFEYCEGYSMEILPDKFFEYNHTKPNSKSYNYELGTEVYYKKASSSFYNQSQTHSSYWIQNVGQLFHRDYFDPDGMPYFMDAYLYVKAGREGKYLSGLETIEDHLGTGDHLPTYRKNFDILSEFNPDKEMINTYLEGDIDKIEAFMNFISSEEFNYWLLTVRNHKMAYVIDSLVQIRPTFNTAGAAHLPGEEGLIQLLEEKGYTLTKVISPFNKTPDVDLSEKSKREWKSINHGRYTIEMPTYIGSNLDQKRNWNICMDYLSEVAYAYTLISDKHFDPNSIIPNNAFGVTKIKNSQYSDDVIEWNYTYQGKKYKLFKISNENDHLLIRITTLHNQPTLPTYDQEISKVINSVSWLPLEKDTNIKEWNLYKGPNFSVTAPGTPQIDTTSYKLNYYNKSQTPVIRFLFSNNKNQYIIRQSTELNSSRYDGFTDLSTNITAIYDSIFDTTPDVKNIDTLQNQVYLEYQIDNQFHIIKAYKKGYTTYSTLSSTNKNDVEEARNFHRSFQINSLIGLPFKTYTSPVDSFSVAFPDVEVDFETNRITYENFDGVFKTSFSSEVQELVEKNFISSKKPNYSFSYEAYDTLSKIRYEVMSYVYRPYFQPKDTSGLISNLFSESLKDSIIHESTDRFEFYNLKNEDLKTRYQATRNNRQILTLRCTYPNDLEAYVDQHFFNTLKPKWQTDTIQLFDNKLKEIKKGIEKEELEAFHALTYNSWDSTHLDFLYSLKNQALENEDLAESLIQVFNDSLQNDSISQFIFDASRQFINLEVDAFFKLITLPNSTSLIAIDSLTYQNMPYDYIDDMYDVDYKKVGENVKFTSDLIFTFNKNSTDKHDFRIINMELLSHIDSAAYNYQPLQDSIIKWAQDILITDSTQQFSGWLDYYLNYLKECPSNKAIIKVFNQATDYNDLEIQASSLIYLLSVGEKADTQLVSKILENPYYRLRFIKILFENKMQDAIPSNYLTKKSIAKSQLYSENSDYIDEKNALKIRFLNEEKIKRGKVKKLVYFFRVDLKSNKYVIAVGYQPFKEGLNLGNTLIEKRSFLMSKDIEKTQEKLLQDIIKEANF